MIPWVFLLSCPTLPSQKWCANVSLSITWTSELIFVVNQFRAWAFYIIAMYVL